MSGTRRRAQWYAKTHGYFWLPCDVCGQPFGGHEKGGGYVLHDAYNSTMTCPQCPGTWVKRGPRYVKLEVALDIDGKPQVREILGSTDWPASVDQTIYVSASL